MAIDVTCEHCGLAIHAPEKYAGRIVKCPRCRGSVSIPIMATGTGLSSFAAIDFETANNNRTSVCAIGLAIVRGGSVANTFSSLIRPDSGGFDRHCVRIHGINASDVKNSPYFADVWPTVAKQIQGLPLLAHSASFDINILCQLNETASAEHFACTCEVARMLLPGLPNHKLSTLTRVFGIELDHHNAESDARACAELGIVFDRIAAPTGLAQFLRPLQEHRVNHVTADKIREGRAYLEISLRNLSEHEDTLIDVAPPDGRFEDKKFVLTGDPDFVSQADAEKYITQQGGRVMSAVSGKTDYVFASDDKIAEYERTGSSTAKLNKAKLLSAKGAKVKVITEAEFLKMIGSQE